MLAVRLPDAMGDLEDIYLAEKSVDEFLENKYRFFGKTVLYEISEECCFEIDELVDLVVAEQLFKRMS